MTRLLDTNVRLFTSDNTTAQLRNEWGSVIKVLDECLVNGSVEKNILSITTVEDPLESTYWLSTVVVGKDHGLLKDATVISISGVSEVIYNAVFRVQEVGDTYIKIAFDKAVVPVQPKNVSAAQGKYKIAPLGYTKVFSDTNKAVYKSNNPNNNTAYLRVDDSCPPGYDPSWTKMARVSVYSDMTAIDDFQPRLGRLKTPYAPEDPNAAEVPTGTGAGARYGFTKWYYATQDNSPGYYEDQTPSGAGPYPFEIIGDDKTFYFTPGLIGYGAWYQKVGYCFGEYENIYDENNKYNHILCCHEAGENANQVQFGYFGSNPGRAEARNVFNRKYDQTGKFILNNMLSDEILNPSVKADFVSLGSQNSGNDSGISYNNYYTDLNFFEVYLRGLYPQKVVFLGKMRGYYWIGNNLQENINLYPKHLQVISNIKNKQSEKFILLTIFRSINGDGEWSGWQNTRIAFKLSNWE